MNLRFISHLVQMIEINNLTTSPIDENFLEKTAKIVLEGEKKEGADLSVALINQGRMKELNKKYRGENRITDVLAFNGTGGELVICPREVKKNAKKFNQSFKKELARVLIHGTLHLLGYDHERDKKEAERVQKKEEYYLLQLKIRKFVN